eukprot:gene18880-24135_t
MCLSGSTGASIKLPAGGPSPHAFLYGEDQGRYLIATDDGGALVEAATKAGVPAVLLGYSGGPDIVVEGLLSVPLQELRDAHEAWLPGFLMPMQAEDIVRLIKEGIPDAEVEIQDLAGDGDHYAATVISASFAGKSKIQQHQAVYGALG